MLLGQQYRAGLLGASADEFDHPSPWPISVSFAERALKPSPAMTSAGRARSDRTNGHWPHRWPYVLPCPEIDQRRLAGEELAP